LTHYKRDLEGRVLEKCHTDTSNHILYKIAYSYDADGNQKTITRTINEKEAVDTFAYDSFNRLIEHQDAEGYVTTTTYNESFSNPLNQNVLQIITIDPRHITHIETQDALARTIRKKVLNPQKTTISCQELTHDPYGNLLYQRDHVYENERFKNTQTINYTYTPTHQIVSLTRGFGTSNAKTTTYTYWPSGKIATKTFPDGITLSYSYNPLGFLSHLDSSDGNIHHAFSYNKLGHLRVAADEKNNIAIKRDVDPFGNVIQETFPSGLEVKKNYDAFNRLISLKMNTAGEVLYTYDPLFLKEVTRISNQGATLYSHTYEDYDLDGNLLVEKLIGNLGQVIHETDLKGQKTVISSPYFSQECKYDPAGNLISLVTDKTEQHYSYDGLSQLISESRPSQSCMYAYDSLYNRLQKNEKAIEINALNELISLGNTSYLFDPKGNQILKKTPSETVRFTYDPLNRLLEIASEKQKVNFTYDPLGRRLSKTISTPKGYGWKLLDHEHYLYHDQNEIGAFNAKGTPKSLRVLGLSTSKNPTTISIELEGRFFAPLLDVQANIRRLIDLRYKSIASSYEFTAFGEDIQKNAKEKIFNPWCFASKRFDPEFGLIYFGKRYYDPECARWLTTDPAGFIDSANLYQYVFNNPFRYIDHDGRFIIALPLLALTWKVVAIAVVTAYVSYELEHQHEHSNSALARGFNSAVHQMVQNIGGVSQYALNQKLDKGKKEVRTEPKDLKEQLTLEEAKAKPQNAKDEIMPDKINDPRYPKEEWKKVEHTHEKPDGTYIDIHYWEDRLTGEKHDFKFKND